MEANLTQVTNIEIPDEYSNIEHCQYYDTMNVGDVLKPNGKSLSILHINIRSLNLNKNKICNLMSINNIFPEVITITETKLKSETVTTNILDIQGYNFIHTPTCTEYGGAGIYIRSGIKYEIRDDLRLNIDDCEDAWIEVLTNDKSVIISSIYRHTKYKRSVIHNFKENLMKRLEELNKKNRIFYLLGDFNLNLLKYAIDNNIKSYIDSIYSISCINVIDKPTRVTEDSSTLIDHIYTNDNVSQIIPGICTSDISDHFPTFIKIQRKCYWDKKMPKYVRDTKSFIEKDFLIDLEIKMNEELGKHANAVDNVDTGFLIFNKTFNEVLNLHAPLRRESRNDKRHRLNPWITKGIRKCIKNKDRLYRKAILRKRQENFGEYKKYRNALNRLIDKAKKRYYERRLYHNQNNTIMQWKIINEIVSKKKKSAYKISKIKG